MKLVRPVTVTQAKLTSNVAQAETLWSAATTYGAAAAVYEVIGGVPMRFVSKAGGNLNRQPSLDTTETYWDPQGATNRWKALDGTIQTQTTNADLVSVAVDLDASEAVDTVRVSNVSATSVRVRQTDAVAGVVYDTTFDLTSEVGIDDYLAWFTEPIVRKAGLTVSGLNPLYPGAVIAVDIAEAGATVAVGQVLMGLARELGGTRWGTELSFRDLSVKAEDDFGGLYVRQGAFKRAATFDFIVYATFVDELQRLLELYRAEPVLFIGNDDYDTMALYGFAKSYKTLVNWPDRSLATLDVESLA